MHSPQLLLGFAREGLLVAVRGALLVGSGWRALAGPCLLPARFAACPGGLGTEVETPPDCKRWSAVRDTLERGRGRGG
jgi:hypothetical protein